MEGLPPGVVGTKSMKILLKDNASNGILRICRKGLGCLKNLRETTIRHHIQLEKTRIPSYINEESVSLEF
ncbi:unnamed protein product [Larinioides sclopetarius]|uniref:Uncharacterized protein n=1 Tax=Larinioides sclopetarius TaxID=280406 RepID=A0AAV1YYE4_9ARAC